jgi:hypothetical protein
LKQPLFAFALFVGLAKLLCAQTPPNEPSDFSATWIGSSREQVMLPLLGGGEPENGRHADNITGQIFEDFTGQRLRLDFPNPDGSGQIVFQLYMPLPNMSLQYVYDIKTQTCQKSTFLRTMVPFFGFLIDAKLVQQDTSGPITLNTWRTEYPKGSDIKAVEAVIQETPATPVSVQWRAPYPVELKFTSFVPGRPAPTVFVLPAACAGL